jgi:hypothetical protein
MSAAARPRTISRLLWTILAILALGVAVGFVWRSGGLSGVFGRMNAAAGTPSVHNDTFTISQDVEGAPVDPLANDTDPNGDALHITDVSNAHDGTVRLVDGGLRYTPRHGFLGVDSAAYTVADPEGHTAEGRVTFNVVANAAPLPAPDALVAVPGETTRLEVATNDTDPEGSALTIMSVDDPAHGTAAIDGSVVTYAPDADFSGIDEFAYIVADGLGRTAPALIAVSVPATTCTAQASALLDEDGDRYDNSDELVSGTDPCDAASTPADTDGDGASDRTDPFALDATNGMTIALPAVLAFDATLHPGTILGVGFSGTMSNGADPYTSLFDPNTITVTSRTLSIEQVARGDALEADNTELNALLFGVRHPGTPFTVHARMLAPFPAEAYQSAGMFIGTGDQDNYLKLVVSAAEGRGGIKITFEEEGQARGVALAADDRILSGASVVDLYLHVDPATGRTFSEYAVDGSEPTILGGSGHVTIPLSWLSSTRALAVGVIATSQQVGGQFPATWDLLEVTADAP